MKQSFILFTILILTSIQASEQNFETALDEMAKNFGEGDKYDPIYFKRLVKCANKFNDSISLQSQNDAWKGIQRYHKTNGTQKDYQGKKDEWGNCMPGPNHDNRCPALYRENNESMFGDVKIYEPCNYASNIAYYRGAVRICEKEDWFLSEEEINAFKRAFLSLGTGSAFYHGSRTFVGNRFDNNMIAVIATMLFQSSVRPLPGNSTILKYLSPVPHNTDNLQMTEDIIKMFSEKDTPDWAEFLDKLDLQHHYEISLVCFINTGIALMLPWPVAYNGMYLLTTIFFSTQKDPWNLVMIQFLPELQFAIQDIVISTEQQLEIRNCWIAVVGKLTWAFLWQEYLLPIEFAYGYVGMNIQPYLTKGYNNLINYITGIKQSDQNIIDFENVYPGDKQCRVTSPHAVWHEESANSLMEAVLLADKMNQVLSAATKNNDKLSYK